MPADFNNFLEVMIEKDGTDLFLAVNCPPRLKVHHALLPLRDKPLDAAETEEIAFKLMDERQKGEFIRSNEMNLAFTIAGIARFRTNIFRQRGSVSLVIRMVKFEIPSFEQLNLPEVLKSIVMRPHGLVLVTGATGSGKSTTLAAMIDYRNANSTGHIITLEDPIEFVHRHKQCVVNQREIGLDTESFEVGMKNVLRQAPDVILVGEIRDRPTMEQVMSYAETGHLVLSTLHSINANQTLERVMQFFPSGIESKIFQNLSLTLEAIVSQRLVPRKDGKGRIAAFEILTASPHVRELIAKGQIGELKVAMEQSVQDGMQSFDYHIFHLFQQGLITREAALAAADSQGDINLRFQGLTSGTSAL